MHQHHPKRHLVSLAAAWSIEKLEQRTLLSGGVFDVSKLPVFVPTSGDISDARNGPLANAGATLTQVYTDLFRAGDAVDASTIAASSTKVGNPPTSPAKP